MQMNFFGKNSHPQPVEDPKHTLLYDILSPYAAIIMINPVPIWHHI